MGILGESTASFREKLHTVDHSSAVACVVDGSGWLWPRSRAREVEDLIRRRAEPLKRIISALELTQTVNEGRAEALKAPARWARKSPGV